MSESVEVFSPIRWADDHLQLLDQTRLPREETWLECRNPDDVAGAIRRLSVRGAPAIGVTAAYGLVVGLNSRSEGQDLEQRRHLFRRKAGGASQLARGDLRRLDVGDDQIQ